MNTTETVEGRNPFRPRVSSTVLFLVAALLLTVSGARAQARQSYRVLTYNVAFLPHNFTGIGSGPSTFNALSEQSRVDAIAKRIREGDYDVVVLNEVWTDSAKERFIEKLWGVYLFYVTQMWGPEVKGLASVNQDSALMVFSKFPTLASPWAKLIDQAPYNGPFDPNYEANRVWDPLAPMFLIGNDYGYYACLDSASLEAAGPVSLQLDFIHIDTYFVPVAGCAVAFNLYPQLKGDDGYADKGIGYIRLFNIHRNRPLNLFYTHNQAIYWKNKPTVQFKDNPPEVQEQILSNQKNLAQEAAFMNQFVPNDNRTANEDTLAVGDHNLPGDTYLYHSAVAKVNHLDPSMIGMSFAGARDTFRHDQSPSGEDPGFTWSTSNSAVPPLDPEGNGRLDYVFSRPGIESPDCAQHLRIRRDFKATAADVQADDDPNAAGMDLSDHYALEVTLGPSADRCSPAKALSNPLAPADVDKSVAGQIAHGGAFQWYRFDGEGTYSIRINAPTQTEVTA